MKTLIQMLRRRPARRTVPLRPPKPSPFAGDRGPFDDPFWGPDDPFPETVRAAVRDHERLLDLDAAVRDLLERCDADPRAYRVPVGPLTRLRELTREGGAP